MKKKLPTKLPKFLHRYFWETDASKINPSEYPEYVAKRLMNWGDLRVFKWLMTHFSKAFLKEVAKESRELSNFNKLFWLNYLKVYPIKTLCSQKEFLRKPDAVWPY